MAAHQSAPRPGQARDARLRLVAAPRLVPEAGYRATLRPVLAGPAIAPRIMTAPKILVFDSGVGGLTVFREIARARPDARFVYAADDALFPYGKIPEAALVERVIGLMEGPDRNASARSHRHRLQHGLDAGAARAARALRAALRRHRAGDQAGLRGLAVEARLRARHRGDRCARIHPRADPQFRRGLRSHAGRIGPACRTRRSIACRRADRRRRRSAPRSRPASSRTAPRAPTPSCSPARIIRCCWRASSASRHGRCAGSIRRPRSRAA